MTENLYLLLVLVRVYPKLCSKLVHMCYDKVATLKISCQLLGKWKVELRIYCSVVENVLDNLFFLSYTLPASASVVFTMKPLIDFDECLRDSPKFR